MSFQTDSVDLVQDALTGTVTFPTAFASAPVPPLVIPDIQNDSADDPILLINCYVYDVTASGFSYQLDVAPPSGNYKLIYLAGSPSVFFGAVTALGKRLTGITEFTGTIGDTDRIPFVSMSPLPRTFALTIAMLRQIFAGRLSAVPAAATSTTGPVMGMTVDGDYLYIRTSTGCARIGFSKGQWAISDKALKSQRATHECTSGDIVQTIEFPVPFEGPELPRITFSIGNIEAGDKLLLHGMLTARTLTGCSITLNAAPDSADYTIDYEASIPQ